MTYALHFATDRTQQGTIAVVDATITVASVQPHEILLDVLVHDLSLQGGTPLKIYDDVHRRISVRIDDVMPVVKVLNPDPEDPLRDEAIINTAGLANCVLPDRPHNVGDTWDARVGIASVHWDVRPPVYRDDTPMAVYHYRVPLANPASYGLEVAQELRLDDGFAGTCIVDEIRSNKDGSERRDGATITSTRIR